MEKFSVSLKISALLSLILFMIPINYYHIVQSMKTFENDAFAINHIGLIRGSIQRLVKYSPGTDTKQIAAFIDATFEQIDHRYVSQKSNHLYFKQTGLLTDYSNLRLCWGNIRQLIHDPHRREELIDISERCWEYADQTASKAQRIAETKRTALLDAFFWRVLFVFILILIIISYVILKVRKGLECDIRLDPLTKVFNRTHFMERLNYHVDLAHRSGHPLSLLFIDIDHFKDINDTLGHQTGDKILIQFASFIKSSIRSSDILFRFGGEEFVVIAPECELECAKKLAEKLQQTIETKEFIFKLTVSIGVAQLQESEETGELIKRSDDAMYQAKQSGRNRVIAL